MRRAVGEGELARLAARVLRDGDERRRAVALLVEAPDDVARALRRDHDHVVAVGRLDAPVVDVEAVREEQRRARREVRRDLVAVERRLRAVGHEERDELRVAHRLGRVRTVRPASSAAAREGLSCAQADLDLDAGVGEVERVRVALAAVAEHGDLSREELDVARLDRFRPLVVLSVRRRCGCACGRAPAGAGRCARCARARGRRADGRAPRTRRAPRGGRRSRT